MVFSRTYFQFKAILTLTIRSQVCAASSRISLRANKGSLSLLNPCRVADTLSLLSEKSVFIQHSISRHSAHLLLSSRATPRFPRVARTVAYPVAERNAAEYVTALKFPAGKCEKPSDPFSESEPRRERARPRANGAALLVPTDYNRLAELVTDSAPVTRAMDCHS